MSEVRISYEERRGCGYRQVGGLYLVGPELNAPCGALPVELEVCPTCDQGVKPARGWTWVQPHALLWNAVHECRRHPCSGCALYDLAQGDGQQRAGLLWIGEEYYPLPNLFTAEARDQGVSRRIPTLPNGFELGRTWVLLAHRKAINRAHVLDAPSPLGPGIFGAFLPHRVEKVVTDEQAADAAAMQKLRDRGIEPVIVRRRGEP